MLCGLGICHIMYNQVSSQTYCLYIPGKPHHAMYELHIHSPISKITSNDDNAYIYNNLIRQHDTADNESDSNGLSGQWPWKSKNDLACAEKM